VILPECRAPPARSVLRCRRVSTSRFRPATIWFQAFDLTGNGMLAARRSARASCVASPCPSAPAPMPAARAVDRIEVPWGGMVARLPAPVLLDLVIERARLTTRDHRHRFDRPPLVGPQPAEDSARIGPAAAAPPLPEGSTNIRTTQRACFVPTPGPSAPTLETPKIPSRYRRFPNSSLPLPPSAGNSPRLRGSVMPSSSSNIESGLIFPAPACANGVFEPGAQRHHALVTGWPDHGLRYRLDRIGRTPPARRAQQLAHPCVTPARVVIERLDRLRRVCASGRCRVESGQGGALAILQRVLAPLAAGPNRPCPRLCPSVTASSACASILSSALALSRLVLPVSLFYYVALLPPLSCSSASLSFLLRRFFVRPHLSRKSIRRASEVDPRDLHGQPVGQASAGRCAPRAIRASPR